MDLLFKRYASPFVLLDNLILTNSLLSFITDLFNFIKEENEERVLWEFFLHKVFDKNWGDYLKETKTSNENHENVDLNATIRKSFDMLQDFTPDSEV